MNVNRALFSSWAPGALEETIVQAEKLLARHGGDYAKALSAIADLAGGNVSLQCRAHFQPIERVLRAAQDERYDSLNREAVRARNLRYHEVA